MSIWFCDIDINVGKIFPAWKPLVSCSYSDVEQARSLQILSCHNLSSSCWNSEQCSSISARKIIANFCILAIIFIINCSHLANVLTSSTVLGDGEGISSQGELRCMIIDIGDLDNHRDTLLKEWTPHISGLNCQVVDVGIWLCTALLVHQDFVEHDYSTSPLNGKQVTVHWRKDSVQAFWVASWVCIRGWYIHHRCSYRSSFWDIFDVWGSMKLWRVVINVKNHDSQCCWSGMPCVISRHKKLEFRTSLMIQFFDQSYFSFRTNAEKPTRITRLSKAILHTAMRPFIFVSSCEEDNIRSNISSLQHGNQQRALENRCIVIHIQHYHFNCSFPLPWPISYILSSYFQGVGWCVLTVQLNSSE